MNENTLLNDIRDFVEERLNESYTRIVQSKDYKKIANEYSKLMTQIEKIVSNVELTDRYKKVELDMYEMQLEQAYKTGFLDSIIIVLSKEI